MKIRIIDIGRTNKIIRKQNDNSVKRYSYITGRLITSDYYNFWWI